jgi:hypothetical protein
MAAYRPSANVNDLLRQFQANQSGRPAAYTPSAYTPSADVTNYQQVYQQAQQNQPGAYTSQWSNQLSDLYNQIANRPAFSYDLNADMLYQQYRDQYTRGGRQAMRDTMGQASAMTGGYGNSYAQTAGQQAYQSYMQQLNDVIPQLEERAYGRYRDQGTDLYNLYGLTAGNEDRDYGRYRDQVGDWRSDRDFAYGQYQDERGFDYGQYQDNRNFDYGQYRDSVADWRDDRNFSYDLYTNERSWDAQQQAAAAAASRGRSTNNNNGNEFEMPEDAFQNALARLGSSGMIGVNSYLQGLERQGANPEDLLAIWDRVDRYRQQRDAVEAGMAGEHP